MTAPSTGTTSPFRTTRRSPGSITSKSTSSSRPFRWRTAVCGTRARSAVISRLARRSAKSSRYCPPAYIKATTTAARYSAEVLGKDLFFFKQKTAYDIQPDIAASQADDDLRHERE